MIGWMMRILINLRVGAITMKNGKLLMVGNDRAPYLYSVGGRIKFWTYIKKQKINKTNMQMYVY